MFKMNKWSFCVIYVAFGLTGFIPYGYQSATVIIKFTLSALIVVIVIVILCNKGYFLTFEIVAWGIKVFLKCRYFFVLSEHSKI